MAKFNVVLRDKVVPANQKGYLSRWAGKTLHDNVEYHADEDGQFFLVDLEEAGFKYVADKIREKGYAFSWATSKVSKFIKGKQNEATSTPVVSPATEVVAAQPEPSTDRSPGWFQRELARLEAERQAEIAAAYEAAMAENAKRSEPVAAQPTINPERKRRLDKELDRYGMVIISKEELERLQG